MKTISRYIMTLALLITAATGAWAQTETLLTTITASSDFTSGSKTFDEKVTVTFSGTVNYNSDDGWNFYDSAADPITMTITAAKGYTITSVILTIGDATLNDNEAPFVATLFGDSYYPKTTISDLASGIWGGVTKIEVYGYETPASGPEVTISDDKTEASFNMPAFDATAEYELVRDMAVSMTTKVGDGEDGAEYRIRVKKNEQGEGYVPAEMSPQAMAGLITVTDDIEEKTLTNVTDYTVSIFAIDNNGEPTGDAIAFQDLIPGRYVAIATAADGSAYDGATEQSNVFVLFQGYEIEVPAGEFATFYKDEPLYVEDEAAELYTISSVNGDQAVLSDKSDAMPSNTPMLVYNKSNETKTFLLIPCAEPDMDITVAPEFQGTLTGTTIAASTENVTNYAFNGKQFVWVKDDITVGANKAWLSVNTGEPSARITIVFDEATGVNEVIGVKEVNDGSWYDLNGRKLQGIPTKKGVYLFNGRKVVVK